jgi:hypothetical protein
VLPTPHSCGSSTILHGVRHHKAEWLGSSQALSWPCSKRQTGIYGGPINRCLQSKSPQLFLLPPLLLLLLLLPLLFLL